MNTLKPKGRWQASDRAMLQSVAIWENDRCLAEVEVFDHDERSAIEVARLMAAAPQLLEAAQKARAALATAVIAHGGGLFHHNNVGEHRVVGLLDAAIAAATAT